EWRGAKLVEAAQVPVLAQAMVAIDSHHDHLTLARKSRWQPPKEHPDIDPAHEALQLLEQFRELRRQPATAKRPDDFQKWLREGESAAGALESLLREAKSRKKLDPAALDKAFAAIGASCAACHTKYRD